MDKPKGYFSRVRYDDDEDCGHAHETLRDALDCNHGGSHAVVVALTAVDSPPEPVGWDALTAALTTARSPQRGEVAIFRANAVSLHPTERIRRFGAVAASTIAETINAEH